MMFRETRHDKERKPYSTGQDETNIKRKIGKNTEKGYFYL